MYVDFGVRPGSAKELSRILDKLESMGYKVVVLEVGSDINLEEARREAEERGLKLLTKIVVKASTRREARRALDSAPKADIVVLQPTGLDAARYAAANKRVHAVKVEPGYEMVVDRGELRVLKAKGFGGFEVSLIHAVRRLDSRTLRFYHRVFRRSYALKAPLAVSSDAESLLDLWEPHSAAAFIAGVARIPYSAALRWLGSTLGIIAPGALEDSRS